MVTADQQKQATRKLTHWLESEKKLVTFRELSREVGCHVNTAKNLLLDYFEAHPSLAPTYIISGYLLSTSSLAQTQIPEDTPDVAGTQRVKIVDMDEMSDADRNSEDGTDLGDGDDAMDTDKLWGNDHGAEGGLSGHGALVDVVKEEDDIVSEEVKRWGIVLVQGEDLEKKRELFESKSLSVHIYALSPSPIKDPAQYLVPNLALRSNPKYYNPQLYGTLSGATLQSFDEKIAKPMKDGGMDFGTSSKKDVRPTVKDVSKATTGAAPIEKTKAGSSSRSSKDDLKPPQEVKTSSKPLKSKKRVITSDDEDEGANPPKASSSKIPLQATSSEVRADDEAAMAAMMDMDMDVGMTSEADEKPKKSDATKTSGTGKKRKRKVTKQEMDADGYMVSRDVWEDVSGSEEPEEDVKPVIPPATKKVGGDTSRKSSASLESAQKSNPGTGQKATGGGAKKGGQSTLAGFFKKK